MEVQGVPCLPCVCCRQNQRRRFVGKPRLSRSALLRVAEKDQLACRPLACRPLPPRLLSPLRPSSQRVLSNSRSAGQYAGLADYLADSPGRLPAGAACPADQEAASSLAAARGRLKRGGAGEGSRPKAPRASSGLLPAHRARVDAQKNAEHSMNARRCEVHNHRLPPVCRRRRRRRPAADPQTDRHLGPPLPRFRAPRWPAAWARWRWRPRWPWVA